MYEVLQPQWHRPSSLRKSPLTYPGLFQPFICLLLPLPDLFIGFCSPPSGGIPCPPTMPFTTTTSLLFFYSLYRHFWLRAAR